MAAISLQSKPRRSRDITFQSMPPDTILLNLESGYYYSTNKLGTETWQRCDGETTISAMIAELHPHYEVSLEQLSADILGFIEEMVAEGLLLVEAHA